MAESYGEATYVPGRHRKNPVLIYNSRTERNKVYEFMIATKYKIPGLVSWKCVSCSKVKNTYRNLGEKLKRKVPLILVDNDIIKEDPDRPLNAEHFCNGKDAVDAVLDRARIEFLHRHGNKEPSSARIHEAIHDFAREAASSAPIPLNMKEKRLVQRTLDAKCLPLLHGVSKRRRWKQRKEACQEKNYDRDEESIVELGEGTSTFSNIALTEPSSADLSREVKLEQAYSEETPRKKARRVNRPSSFITSPQTVRVRPLPPYNYTRPTASQSHSSYRNHDLPLDFYDGVGIVEEVNHTFSDVELISGSQQQVAYNVEV